MNCFVIMPIENPETEPIWENVYIPVIEGAGLAPKRIDKEDEGTLLPTQIVQYINQSPLIIADLTLARPNCYLEVGYAMGLNKYNNLILCCREDHNIHSPKYSIDSEKVHFDLQSYGIIWWNQNDLDSFKEKLAEKIEFRKEKILKLTPKPQKATIDVNKTLIKDLILKERKELKKWKKMT